jgi:hypothetical protein
MKESKRALGVYLDDCCEVSTQPFAIALCPDQKQSNVQYLIHQESSEKKRNDMIDLSKRYDVYCREGSEAVVYRNVLFKGLKKLFEVERFSALTEYIEIEQADGKTIFFSRTSIVKFCEHEGTPNAETAPGKKE